MVRQSRVTLAFDYRHALPSHGSLRASCASFLMHPKCFSFPLCNEFYEGFQWRPCKGEANDTVSFFFAASVASQFATKVSSVFYPTGRSNGDYGTDLK